MGNLIFGKTKAKQQHTTYGSLAAKTSVTNLTNSSTNLAFTSKQTTSNDSTINGLGTSFSLIDLSPPGSPTFTTRSSSDAVSVDSFGSDGNSNPSAFTTSSGSTSQTESAFEDDFDFFGNLSGIVKKNNANDPWKISCSQDPFGSIEPASSKPIVQQVSFFFL